MCQLLGMNCKESSAITLSFAAFAARGGITADHTDGWGIAFYERAGCRVFLDDQPASRSKLAQFVRDHPIESKLALAHLRMATQGEVSLANCQPFQREWLGQTWLFAHTGDLRNFHRELTGAYLPVGSSDSEKAFCWVMQQLRNRFTGRARPPAWQELAEPVAELAEAIAHHGNFNFMLSNGEALYVHCSSRLHVLEGDRRALVATEPLTNDEPWSALATGEMRVFVDGACTWRRVSETTRAFPVACRITPAVWIERASP